MFKRKFQEQPVHKNKERFTYYGMPGAVLCLSFPVCT